MGFFRSKKKAAETQQSEQPTQSTAQPTQSTAQPRRSRRQPVRRSRQRQQTHTPLPAELARLYDAVQTVREPVEEFRPGSVVTWVEGLHMNEGPMPGQPSVVVQVFSKPIRPKPNATQSLYREYNMVVGYFDVDDTYQESFVDARRFRKASREDAERWERVRYEEQEARRRHLAIKEGPNPFLVNAQRSLETQGVSTSFYRWDRKHGTTRDSLAAPGQGHRQPEAHREQPGQRVEAPMPQPRAVNPEKSAQEAPVCQPSAQPAPSSDQSGLASAPQSQHEAASANLNPQSQQPNPGNERRITPEDVRMTLTGYGGVSSVGGIGAGPIEQKTG